MPQLFNNAQQEAISQILLGFIYFVLPVGVGLSVFLHDKCVQQRSAILNKPIEILEQEIRTRQCRFPTINLARQKRHLESPR